MHFGFRSLKLSIFLNQILLELRRKGMYRGFGQVCCMVEILLCNLQDGWWGKVIRLILEVIDGWPPGI